MQGQIVNGFELKKLLGEGGMAEVWYAENEIGKPAAVKILFEKLTRNERIVERFHNEAVVMVKLRHPNIRQVYSYGYLGNRHCIVMEYLEGNDLSDMMKSGRRFTEAELRLWWDQIVSALNYTHKQGIVHRDIKPSNIFLDEDGNIKLLDFGIAKMMESSSLTQTGAQMGTLLYMSPEQVMDSKNIDYHTDIYSLAITFVNLLTGKKPYDTETTSDFQIRERIVYAPFDVSVLPADWQGFLAPYLEKEPQNRPELRKFEPTPLASVAQEMHGGAPTEEKNLDGDSTAEKTSLNDHSKLAEVHREEGTRSTEAPTASIPKDAPKRKSKAGLWIGLGVGVVVLAVAVLLLVLFMKPNPDTEAYEACTSISDYRNYIHEFGTNGLHYNEAKAIVDKHVADSTAKALAQERARLQAEAEQKEDASYKKCTTIAACDSYLKDYPKGRYVSEVKAKKEELEKKEAEKAKAKAEADRKQKEIQKGNQKSTKQGTNVNKSKNSNVNPSKGKNEVNTKKKTVKVKKKN